MGKRRRFQVKAMRLLLVDVSNRYQNGVSLETMSSGIPIVFSSPVVLDCFIRMRQTEPTVSFITVDVKFLLFHKIVCNIDLTMQCTTLGHQSNLTWRTHVSQVHPVSDI